MPQISITPVTQHTHFFGPQVWKKDISQSELNDVNAFLISSKSSVGFIKATLYPIRTNNWGNFAKDLFIPNFCMRINKVIILKNAINKIIVFVQTILVELALIFDLLTLPIRLLTCIPRLIFNNSQDKFTKSTLLYQYISRNAGFKAAALLKADSVRVELQWETTENLFVKVTKIHRRQINYHFIQVPDYPNHRFDETNTETKRINFGDGFPGSNNLPPKPQPPKECPYKALGLKEGAKLEDIKVAYKKLVLKYHPDRVRPEDKEAAQEKFVKIDDAYKYLCRLEENK